MKRYIYILFALIAVSVSAQTVSREQARQTALRFLEQAGVEAKLSTQPMKAPVAGAHEGDAPAYYVFNADDGKAHAIVSAIHNEVISYSPSHALNTANMPDNMKWYMEALAKVGMPKKAQVHNTIAPLVKTKWHQNSPFNDELEIGDVVNGEPVHCVTGCVPIAIAQIMNFYNWPKESGYIPGYEAWHNENDKGARFLEPDEEPKDHEIGNPQRHPSLSSIAFEYDKYLDDYKGLDDRYINQKNAVAKFVKYIGHMLGAHYTSKSTNVTDGTIGYVLSEKLFYGKQLVQREKGEDFMNGHTWDMTIYNELSNGRPVLMVGEDKIYKGHAWICDGYQNGLYHMNWGWEKEIDTYVGLLVLNPDIYHFNYTIIAYSGLVPSPFINLSVSSNDQNLTLKVGQNAKLNYKTEGNPAYSSYPHYNAAKNIPAECFEWKSSKPEYVAVTSGGYAFAKKATDQPVQITMKYKVGSTTKSINYYVTVEEGDIVNPLTPSPFVNKYTNTVNNLIIAQDNDASEDQLATLGNELNDIKNEFSNQGSEAEDSEAEDPKTYVGAYECVDLGLPSGNKWATKNVGASSPEDAGYYFAWGEAWTKNEYTTDNSLTWNREFSDLKYIGAAQESGGYIRFTNSYDPALQTWGKGWATPSAADTQELIDYCSWQWATVNGETGYRVTGPNGNSIFLPTGGNKDGSSVASTQVGNYWINQASKSNSKMAYELLIQNSRYLNQVTSRHYGYNVRAIAKEQEDEPMDDKLYAKRSYGGHNYAIYWTYDPNDIRTNADGTDFYAATFTIDIDGKTYEIPDKHHIYRKNEDNNTWNGTCAAVDTSNDVFYLYTFSKEDAYDYGMAGYVYEISKQGIKKHEMFTNANFGWHAYFDLDGSSLRWNAFSYAGYYSMVGYKEQDYWSIYLVDFIYPEDFVVNRNQNETIFIY